MSLTIIHQSTQKANKNYICDACNFLFSYSNYDGFTFTEKRAVVKARTNRQKILKGEMYIRQFNTDGGNTWTFRAIPEIHKICINHELYWD